MNGFTVGVFLGVAYCVYYIVRCSMEDKKLLEKRLREDERQQEVVTKVEVELVGDANVAMRTLLKYGFNEEKATELVRKARRSHPKGDYATLINAALKIHE